MFKRIPIQSKSNDIVVEKNIPLKRHIRRRDERQHF